MLDMAQKPTIVLVPGAWHLAAAYKPLTTALEVHGYPVLALSNPSTQYSDPKANLAGDERAARSAILKVLDSGHDVVVLSHSYGGKVGAAAAAGLTKKDRTAKGKKAGVVGFICISSVIVRGETVQVSGGQLAPFILRDTPSPGLTMPGSPIDIFYNDVEPKVAKQLSTTLRPHPTLSLHSPSDAEPLWDEDAAQGKIAYIRCLQDRAIDVEIQDKIVKDSGRKWIVKTLDTSHSPFISKPTETAQVVVDLIDEFTGHEDTP